MSLIRKTLKVTGWITGIAAVGMAAVVLANAFDEPLAPEVKALLERPAPQVAEADNLLNALIGFPIVSADVAENEAFWRIGVRKRAIRRVAADNDARQHAYDVTGDERTLRLIGDRTLLCPRDALSDPTCLSAVAAHRDAVEQLLIDNAEWLRRFHALQRYSTFAADAPISFFDPWILSGVVSTGHALARTEIALQWVRGDRAAAVANLAADLQFWRQFLASTDANLIEKFIAAAGYRSSLVLAATFLRTQALSPDEVAMLEPALAPLPQAAVSLVSAIDREFDYFNAALIATLAAPAASLAIDEDGEPSKLAGIRNVIARYFTLPNATLNRRFRRVQMEIAATRNCAQSAADATPEAEFSLAERLYNPVGNTIADLGAPGYGAYAQRLCDLDGMNRIVGLQLAMARLPRPPGDAAAVAAFVQTADARFADPYTGAPMQVDGQRRVRFEARDPRMKALLPWPI